VAGDLFIDCSGSRSLLLGQHFGVPLKSYRHVLFNDTALAVQLPYADEHAAVATQTLSTAQASGWVWDIGLPTRRGVGHVYSSAHCSEDEAAAALAAYVAGPGGSAPLASYRKLSFEPGHREHFWHRNCVAVGQAAGFIEPLEASALVMVELSAAMLADCLPATRHDMAALCKQFNDTFVYRWHRIMDFLKLHYVLSQRRDSAYWIDNQSPGSIPQRLAELLSMWRYRTPSRHDINRIEEVFPAASYEYILYGMGFLPQRAQRDETAAERAIAERYLRETRERTRQLLAGLPGNRALLDHIRQHRLKAELPVAAH
jgi:tryptophan 7-halogenase